MDRTFVHWTHCWSCGIIPRRTPESLKIERVVRLRALRIALLPVFRGRQIAIQREANGADCTELESGLRLSAFATLSSPYARVIRTRQSVTPWVRDCEDVSSVKFPGFGITARLYGTGSSGEGKAKKEAKVISTQQPTNQIWKEII